MCKFKCIRTPKVWFRKNWNKRVSPRLPSHHKLSPSSLSLSHCACKWSWNNIVGIHGRCLEALRKWGIDMQKTSGLEGHSGCYCDRWKQTGCNFQFFSGLSSPLSPAQASFFVSLIFIHKFALRCSNQPANVKRYCWRIVWFQLFISVHIFLTLNGGVCRNRVSHLWLGCSLGLCQPAGFWFCPTRALCFRTAAPLEVVPSKNFETLMLYGLIIQDAHRMYWTCYARYVFKNSRVDFCFCVEVFQAITLQV